MERRRKIARLKSRVCIVCGKTYKARRIDSIFCSNACTQKDKRQRDKDKVTELKKTSVSVMDAYVQGYIDRGEKIRFESIRNYKLFDHIHNAVNPPDIKPVEEINFGRYKFIRSASKPGVSYDVYRI